MRKASSLHLDPVAVVAGGRDGSVVKCEYGMSRPALAVWRLHRDRPWLSVGTESRRAHLSVDSDQRAGEAIPPKGVDQAIHRVTLGDAVQVERDCCGLSNTGLVDFQRSVGRPTPPPDRLLISGGS